VQLHGWICDDSADSLKTRTNTSYRYIRLVHAYDVGVMKTRDNGGSFSRFFSNLPDNGHSVFWRAFSSSWLLILFLLELYRTKYIRGILSSSVLKSRTCRTSHGYRRTLDNQKQWNKGRITHFMPCWQCVFVKALILCYLKIQESLYWKNV